MSKIRGQEVLLYKDSRILFDAKDSHIFRTGNTIFDEIVNLEFGSCTLIVDQHFSESKQFLSTVLNGSTRSNTSGVIELTTGKSTIPGTDTFNIEHQSLSYLSIAVNSFRETHPRHVLIHSYLPDLLVSSPDHETVLRALQSWKERISEAETVELYLLPRDTFRDFERALRSIVDGVIDITPQTGDRPGTFVPIRGCGLRFENRALKYVIKNGKLLITCGNHFLERGYRIGRVPMKPQGGLLH